MRQLQQSADRNAHDAAEHQKTASANDVSCCTCVLFPFLHQKVSIPSLPLPARVGGRRWQIGVRRAVRIEGAKVMKRRSRSVSPSSPLYAKLLPSNICLARCVHAWVEALALKIDPARLAFLLPPLFWISASFLSYRFEPMHLKPVKRNAFRPIFLRLVGDE